MHFLQAWKYIHAIRDEKLQNYAWQYLHKCLWSEPLDERHYKIKTETKKWLKGTIDRLLAKENGGSMKCPLTK